MKRASSELDRLWDEFEFIADYTARTWVQYFFNQSGEVQRQGRESGTRARPTQQVSRRRRHLRPARRLSCRKPEASPNNPVAMQAIRDHFAARQRHPARTSRSMRAEAEPRHLDALLKFAARAYRRPLTTAERERSAGLLPLAPRARAASPTKKPSATPSSAS